MAIPLFICGFPSGGTDLVKNIINVHPDVHICGEMPFLATIKNYGYHQGSVFSSVGEINKFLGVLKKLDVYGNIKNLNRSLATELAEHDSLSLTDLLRLTFSDVEPTVWGNKTPQNTENIATLNELFPTARFLLVLRDVRDIALSWQKKWGKNRILCAARWEKRMQQGVAALEALPVQRRFILRFEDLLDDTEAACRRICSFLEIPFSEKMLQYHLHTSNRADGKLNYGEAVITSNKNKWLDQMDRCTARRIEEIAYSGLKQHSYPILYAEQQRPITLQETLFGYIDDMGAILFVGNRASQNNTFPKRFHRLLHELRKRKYH